MWVTQSAYAERVGISPATLNYRLKRDKYNGCTRKFGKTLKINLEKALAKEADIIDKQKQKGGLANKAKHQGEPEPEEIEKEQERRGTL